MHRAIEDALGNTRLEYPDFEFDAETLALVESAVKGKITFDSVAEKMIERYKPNA